MKATELRIGNLVSITDEAKKDVLNTCDMELTGDYLVIGNFSIDEINGFIGNELIEFSLSEIEPIPLTAEWLGKLGFRTSGPRLLFLPIPKHGMEILYEMKYYGNVVTLQSDFGMLIPNDIQYIHQLQNLFFALTGEELTIREAAK